MIATAFNIPKTGSTHVSNNEIIADGYKIDDIERAINLDALQKYLGSDETDFMFLWNKLIEKTEGREVIPPEPIEKEPQKAQKKRGRPRKVIA